MSYILFFELIISISMLCDASLPPISDEDKPFLANVWKFSKHHYDHFGGDYIYNNLKDLQHLAIIDNSDVHYIIEHFHYPGVGESEYVPTERIDREQINHRERREATIVNRTHPVYQDHEEEIDLFDMQYQNRPIYHCDNVNMDNVEGVPQQQHCVTNEDSEDRHVNTNVTIWKKNTVNVHGQGCICNTWHVSVECNVAFFGARDKYRRSVRAVTNPQDCTIACSKKQPTAGKEPKESCAWLRDNVNAADVMYTEHITLYASSESDVILSPLKFVAPCMTTSKTCTLRNGAIINGITFPPHDSCDMIPYKTTVCRLLLSKEIDKAICPLLKTTFVIPKKPIIYMACDQQQLVLADSGYVLSDPQYWKYDHTAENAVGSDAIALSIDLSNAEIQFSYDMVSSWTNRAAERQAEILCSEENNRIMLAKSISVSDPNLATRLLLKRPDVAGIWHENIVQYGVCQSTNIYRLLPVPENECPDRWPIEYNITLQHAIRTENGTDYEQGTIMKTGFLDRTDNTIKPDARKTNCSESSSWFFQLNDSYLIDIKKHAPSITINREANKIVNPLPNLNFDNGPLYSYETIIGKDETYSMINAMLQSMATINEAISGSPADTGIIPYTPSSTSSFFLVDWTNWFGVKLTGVFATIAVTAMKIVIVAGIVYFSVKMVIFFAKGTHKAVMTIKKFRERGKGGTKEIDLEGGNGKLDLRWRKKKKEKSDVENVKLERLDANESLF